MKKVWSGLVVLIAICWVITGCQQSSASSGTVEQKLVIEKYIADNQYGHAVKMKDQNQGAESAAVVKRCIMERRKS